MIEFNQWSTLVHSSQLSSYHFNLKFIINSLCWYPSVSSIWVSLSVNYYKHCCHGMEFHFHSPLPTAYCLLPTATNKFWGCMHSLHFIICFQILITSIIFLRVTWNTPFSTF
jgi:hypothetical protein